MLGTGVADGLLAKGDCAARRREGRIVRVGGKLPIKLSAGLFYNVVRPTVGGRWGLKADLKLILLRAGRERCDI
jgi:hypothetical protein